jgi:hypothetical protein
MANINTVCSLTIDEIIFRLKQLNIDKFGDLTIYEVVEKLNYIPDSDDDEKNSIEMQKKTRIRRAPKVKAKEHQNEEMIGEDNNMYLSKEDRNGIWMWKRISNDLKQNDGYEEVKNSEPTDNIKKPKKKSEEKELEIEEDSNKKKPKKRGSPEEKAKDHKNEVIEGIDKRKYISYPDKNGRYLWKLAK